MGELSYEDLTERINRFRLAIYQPTAYLLDREAQRGFATLEQRETYLIGMIRTNFLKRLESSSHALDLTLRRTTNKMREMLGRIDRHEGQAEAGLDEQDILEIDPDGEDEDMVADGKRRDYSLSEINVKEWRSDIETDLCTLEDVHRQIKQITPERDGKLKEIRRAIRNRAENPTFDIDGEPNCKLLVFTTFKDTADYLYDQLEDLAAELNLNMAMVSGNGTRTTRGASNFHEILNNFAPRARLAEQRNDGCIDLLIATDCISEGQNLQDCDTVINYDIHWNPVRIIQRFGRVDRIGSRNRVVQMLNYWPTQDMEVYLNLHSRVQARMMLADTTGSGDENPLTRQDAERQISFRDEQIRQLRTEVMDLDDLTDTLVMSDYSTDHFLQQLWRFLQTRRDELEAVPPGAYAIAPDMPNAEPGVICLLRQKNADEDGKTTPVTPFYPYYLVYVHADGTVRFGCDKAQRTLTVFNDVSEGKVEPDIALCDVFDRETQHGGDMRFYTGLVNAALEQIKSKFQMNEFAILGFDADGSGILTSKANSPTAPENFELLTWLIIAKPQ